MWLPRGRGADPHVAITVASAILPCAQSRLARTRRSNSLVSAIAAPWHASPRAAIEAPMLYPARQRGHAPAMSRLRLLFVLAFWACLLGAYTLAILPGGGVPSPFHWDKLNHMLAFFTVTALCRLAYPRLRVLTIALAMAAFGGFIEMSQAVPFIHRDAEWADWFADCVAAGIGLLVAWPLAILADRRRNAR
jgi:VanZ family protein